jgi:hypothetical protein
VKRPLRALALLAVIPLLAWAAGGARADSGAAVSEFGWWTQAPGGATAQSGGGIQVADSPAGNVSVAAVRISVSATSLTSANLVLSEGQQVGTAIIQICPTTASWTATSGGAWDQRPEPNCASPIPMERDATTLTWTASVLSLMPSGPAEVSLMIVPGPSTLPAPAPFNINFVNAEIQAEGTTDVPTPAAGPSESSGGGFDTTFGAASDVGSPADFGVPTPLPEPAVAAPAANEQAIAAPSQVGGRFPTRGDTGLPAGGSKQPWGRLPLFVLLAIAVGAAASFGRVQLRDRGLLSA